MSLQTLISASILAEHLDDPQWVIFDCRFSLADTAAGERAYAEGHIPGARYAHLDRDLSSPITASSGRHPLPDPAVLAAKLGNWGVARDTQVVVYDDTGGSIAARLWWLLRWLGHAEVAVLDGGINAWMDTGHPLSRDVPTPEPRTFDARVHDAQWLTTEQVEEGLRNQHLLLIDARAEERFRGEVEPIDPVAGHIPGAVNHPLQQNLNAEGCFKPIDTVREYYDALLNGRRPQEVAHMCGSGVTACHNLLAMELTGLSGSRLYVGSWSE